MPDEFFYYNRQKSFMDGLILTIVSLLFQPFYLLFHEGLIGIIISILPFKFLFRGLIYLIRSFWTQPAIKLTPQGFEFDTLFMIRKKLKWNEIRSIEWREEEARRHANNNSDGGSFIKFRFRISDYEKNFIDIQATEEKSYSISMDSINLEGKDIEQMIRDYKRMYYFEK